jgi:hypothetical protein
VGVTSAYAHLLPAVQMLADAPDEVRIRRLRTDRWIGYARAETVLAQMQDLLSFPPRTRMPNLFLVGPTNNGKTMILEKFRRTHRPDEQGTPHNALCVPVLTLQMPPSPDEHSFFSAILSTLGAGDRINDRRLQAKQDLIVRLMRAAAVRLLAIDEVHNLLCGSPQQQRRFLNLLRWLGNELQIPLLAVGTAEGLRAIQSDEQLANRFTPFSLPLWHADAEYTRLLNTLELLLPLRQPSGLAEPALAQKILAVSEGVLGEIVSLIVQAAVAAIRQGHEAIRMEVLDNISFIPPTQRRHVHH